MCIYIPITRGRLSCVDVAGAAHSVAASWALLFGGCSEKVAVCSTTMVAVAANGQSVHMLQLNKFLQSDFFYVELKHSASTNNICQFIPPAYMQ